MVLWSSGLSRLPVTEKIASSNLVRTAICECSSTVEHHLAKVDTAVRFRSLAPFKNSLESEFFLLYKYEKADDFRPFHVNQYVRQSATIHQ